MAKVIVSGFDHNMEEIVVELNGRVWLETMHTKEKAVEEYRANSSVNYINSNYVEAEIQSLQDLCPCIDTNKCYDVVIRG